MKMTGPVPVLSLKLRLVWQLSHSHQSVADPQFPDLRIGQVPFDQFIQTQTFVQLPHQNQATVRRDSRSLEIDLQGAVERKLKGLVLFLTHRVLTSGASSAR
jgi:hypothetical protein